MNYLKNKDLYLIVFLIFIHQITYTQEPLTVLTFDAEYYGQAIETDSILIENLTQPSDTMLYYPDNILVLSSINTGFSTNQGIYKNGFQILQNSPNPFKENTELRIYLSIPEWLEINIFNLQGQKAASFSGRMEAAMHRFQFCPGKDKVYIVSATVKGETQCIRVINLNHHPNQIPGIKYLGSDGQVAERKSGNEIITFIYNPGDSLRYTGYGKHPAYLAGSDVIVDIPDGDQEYTFEIIEGFPCSDMPLIMYEGQLYTTVKIGEQCWLKENLNAGIMIPGDNSQADNGITEKFCYGNQESNCEIYGGLYQWEEMMLYQTQTEQGICPAGWHLPSDDEFTVLNDHLGGQYSTGGKLKESESFHWLFPNNGATNESGFTALPGGLRNDDTYFYALTESCHFWTRTHSGATTYSWQRAMTYENPNFYRLGAYIQIGFSVRCLRDGAPVAAFTGIPTTGPAPLTVNFTDQSTNNPTSWLWDFGDGGTSTLQNPSHDYVNTGSFTVQLSVGNPYGSDTEVKINYITVTPIMGEPCPGTPTVTYEGQTYNTVQIGTQCWFKENLNVGTMIYGSTNQTNNSQIEKYCYSNNIVNCAIYGGLYQWNEMMQYTTQQGTQGICPSGWHIPTDQEWCTLAILVDPTVDCNVFGYSGTDVATRMKSTIGWATGYNGTNTSGFTALPGGYRDFVDGSFDDLTIIATFWSTTESSYSVYATTRMLYFIYNGIQRYSYSKMNGFSVRCLKD